MRNTIRWMLTALCVLHLGMGAARAADTPYVTANGTVSPNSTFSGNVGMEITVGSLPMLVSSIGRYIIAGNSHTHTLEIIRADDSAVVGSGSVNAATGTAGTYDYVSLTTPVQLAAGATYYIVSSETASQDSWGNGTSVTTTTDASDLASVAGQGAALNPNASSANTCYGPLNIQYHTLAAPTTISCADSNAYFGSNWRTDTTGTPYKGTWRTGAECKIGFTGTNNISLLFDVSHVGSLAPFVAASVDGTPFQQINVTAYGVCPLNVPSGTSHTLVFHLYDSNVTVERWTNPYELRCIGFQVDNGGASCDPNTLSPGFLARNGAGKVPELWVIGTSIEEGLQNLSVGTRDASQGWGYAAAQGLGMEPVLWGASSEGLLQAGAGNEPQYYNAASDATSAWDHYDSSHSLLSGGQYIVPSNAVIGRILFCHAFNDQGKGTTYQTALAALLPLMRAAAPSAPITLLAPFCDVTGAAAIRPYMSAGLAASGISYANYIDLGPYASFGLPNPGGALAGGTAASWDGVHPSAAYSGRLGSEVATAVLATIATPFQPRRGR